MYVYAHQYSAQDSPATSTDSSTAAFHFLAGLASGTFTAILLQPADLLKTRVQQSTTKTAHPLLSTLREIASSSSPIKNLWRGTLPSALRTGAGSALYFGGLNALRTRIQAAGLGVNGNDGVKAGSSALPKLSKTTNLLTGAIARASAGFAMMPITVIKVRFESNMYNYKSIFSAGADILRVEGFKGFFAGFGATAVRDAPYAGLYVLFYEESKRRLAALTTPTPSDPTILPLEPVASKAALGINFLSGVLAAGTATAITNPFDAIKTRLQLMPQRYGNMLKAARMMVREEGFRCLFDGLALRMGRKAISSALAWTVYEELIRRAEIRWTEEDL
jgi:solute carrier family 25 protein 38